MNFNFEYYTDNIETNHWYRKFLADSNQHSIDCISKKYGTPELADELKKAAAESHQGDLVEFGSNYVRISLDGIVIGYARGDTAELVIQSLGIKKETSRLRDVYVLEEYRNRGYFKSFMPGLLEFLSAVSIELTIYNLEEHKQYYVGIGFNSKIRGENSQGVYVINKSLLDN